MKTLTPLQVFIQQVGGIAMILGAAVFMWWPWVSLVVFAAGALAFCCIQVIQSYEGRNFIIRRLRRQQLLGGVALMVTPPLMYMHIAKVGFAQHSEWMVALAIGCVLQLYTAFRIPAELEKEK